MFYVLIRHKVTDFAKWKVAYDAHATERQGAGLKESHLMRSVANPNEVVLLFTAADLKRAQAFAASADLRAAMQEAGVADKPDIYFLN